MIQDGDKIAVGLSGGKDSICLLAALKHLQIYSFKKFDLLAITINPNFETFDIHLLEDICQKLEVPLLIKNSFAKDIVFDIRKEKNPCSLCANLRRGIMGSIAKEEGCNKIALGHNQDDVIETLLMSLLYNGKIHTFAPINYMDRSCMTVIRPLVYLLEKEIRSFIKRNNFAVMEKCCPMDGNSKREDIKDLIANFQTEIPHIKSHLFGAIQRSNIKGWESD